MSRSALIVGINQYASSTLRLPAIDAEAIAKLLETQGEFHVKRLHEAKNTETQKPMVSTKKPVTLSELKAALVELFTPDSAQYPDVALFYFAGHGVLESCGSVNEGYLVTSDANLSNVWGLSLDWLRRLLQASPIKNKIVWLDCCHGGALMNFNDIVTFKAGDNIGFIAAALAHEKAYEDIAGDHGTLTKVLLQGLACHHQDRVNNFELTAFVEKKFKAETQTPITINLGKAIDLCFNHQQSPVVAPSQPNNAPCPYKGLLYFDCNETDAQNFYGREELINDLIDAFRNNNFIAVLGASGSGKSSVVRAGLLYRLQTRQYINGCTEWQQRIFTPTGQPLDSLARAFVDSTRSQIEQTTQFQQGKALLQTLDGFRDLILMANTKVILCVDQFEELFTLCADNLGEREQFLNLVLNALSLPELQGKFALIITLRADFLAHCLERDYHGLGKLIQQHSIVITPLNEADLRASIIEPAQKSGITVEAALVQHIIDDSQDAVGYLPLLQDVLMTLWQQGLTLNNYVAVGGLYGALEQRATAVYEQFSPEQQQVAQAIFLSLITLGEGTQDTRRRAVKAELLSARCHEALLNDVLLILAKERLIVTSALASRDASSVEDWQSYANETILDIAHEALIQHWQSLRQWLSDNREFKAWRDRLAFSIKEWHKTQQDPDGLLRGTRLLEAEERLNNHKDDLNSGELAFIHASSALCQQEQREKTKRRRFWLGGLIVFSLSVSVLAGLSYWQYQQAEQQKQIALAVLNQFTYEIPEALANIPQTAHITADILHYNIQALDKIYALNPNDKKAQREQGSNYSRVGNLYLELLGDVDKALDFYQKSSTLLQKIAQQDPRNLAAQRDLSVSFEKLGDSHLALKQTDKALSFYQQALEISQKIAQQDPSNSAAQRDLSVSFEKLGDGHLVLKQTDKALSFYQQSFDGFQKIAQQDPSNSAAQRALSVSFNKLGDIHLALKQTDKALSFYQQSSDILQKIAQQDPNNSAAQRDLFVSYTKLGSVHKQLNQNTTALAFFQQALPIAEQRASDTLNHQAQQDLQWVQQAISALSTARGR